MDRNESLKHVVNYILDEGGEVDGLTPEKIWDRAQLVDAPERPDWIVFEVERHRALLTNYTPGLPMESFVTYWPRYALHPQTKAFESLGEHRSPVVDLDCGAVANSWITELMYFSFESVGGGKFLCKEACFIEERVVENMDDVESFGVELAKKLNIEHMRYDLEEYLEKEKVEESLNEIRQALEAAAGGKAISQWETFVCLGN